MSFSRSPNSSLAAKYRNRRIAGLVVLALLIWGIWSAISAIGSIFASPNAAKAGEACAAGAVQIDAHVGDGSKELTQFYSGDTVKIWYSVTNIGNVSCTFNLGTKVTFFKVTSGAETIWDSRQCDRSADADYVVTLEPAVTVTSDAGTWEKVSSSASGCNLSSGQLAATAGGASYHLTASVNSVVSSNNPQFSLN